MYYGLSNSTNSTNSTICYEQEYVEACTRGTSYKTFCPTTQNIKRINYKHPTNSWSWSNTTTCNWDVEHAIEDTSQWYYRWENGEAYRVPALSPQDRLREIIQSRQSPLVVRSRKVIGPTENIPEQRARETLRRVLGEDGFRAFIRNGFISVRARSGLTYQIFTGHGMTNVYRDGEKIEKLCVVLRGDFPPTDSLIMRYLLILNDERDFRKHAISHRVYPKKMVTPVQVPGSLPELFRGFKVA